MEVPKDVLPESSQVEVEETEVVEEVKPIIPEAKTEPKGTKTPDENLYAALAEERRKRKEAEDKLFSISTEPQVSEAFSDEGKLLDGKIKTLESVINNLQEEKVLAQTYSKYPELTGLTSEFDSYRADFPGAKAENVAKLFLMEKGLLNNTPRKGLEKQTSGGQVPVSDGLTAEEVSDLRKNNHRKYTELLMSGKIKLDELGA